RSLKEECHVCHSDRLRGGRPFALGLSVRGHQGGRSRVSTPLLPLTALPGHRTPAYFVRQKASTSTVRPYRSYFGFPWWTKLRALLCWSWARRLAPLGLRGLQPGAGRCRTLRARPPGGGAKIRWLRWHENPTRKIFVVLQSGQKEVLSPEGSPGRTLNRRLGPSQNLGLYLELASPQLPVV